MARHKNANWNLPEEPDYPAVQVAALLDIRDELQRLNNIFACPNFLAVPQILRDIQANTTPKPKRRKKASRG